MTYCTAPAAAEDLVEIKTLLSASGLPSTDLTASKLKSFWVARDPNSPSMHNIVGVIGLETFSPPRSSPREPHNHNSEGVALLRSLAVKEGYRNQGIAQSLCDEMETFARVHYGIRQLYLLTTTAEEYFCNKRGFERTDRKSVPASIQSTSEFSGGLCPCSAVCLTKHLEELST